MDDLIDLDNNLDSIRGENEKQGFFTHDGRYATTDRSSYTLKNDKDVKSENRRSYKAKRRANKRIPDDSVGSSKKGEISGNLSNPMINESLKFTVMLEGRMVVNEAEKGTISYKYASPLDMDYVVKENDGVTVTNFGDGQVDEDICDELTGNFEDAQDDENNSADVRSKSESSFNEGQRESFEFERFKNEFCVFDEDNDDKCLSRIPYGDIVLQTHRPLNYQEMMTEAKDLPSTVHELFGHLNRNMVHVLHRSWWYGNEISLKDRVQRHNSFLSSGTMEVHEKVDLAFSDTGSLKIEKNIEDIRGERVGDKEMGNSYDGIKCNDNGECEMIKKEVIDRREGIGDVDEGMIGDQMASLSDVQVGSDITDNFDSNVVESEMEVIDDGRKSVAIGAGIRGSFSSKIRTFKLYNSIIYSESDNVSCDIRPAKVQGSTSKNIFVNYMPPSISIKSTFGESVYDKPLSRSYNDYLIQFDGVKAPNGCEEPLFFQATFYDVEKKVRLTETFGFDWNSSNEFVENLLNSHRSNERGNRLDIKSFLVNLNYKSSKVYLVVRLLGLVKNVSDNLDPYSNVLSFKDRQKWIDSARKQTMMMGGYVQGFAWGYVRIFNENGAISDDLLKMNFFRIKTSLSDEVLYEQLIFDELKRHKQLELILELRIMDCNREMLLVHSLFNSSLNLCRLDNIRSSRAQIRNKSLTNFKIVTEDTRIVDDFEFKFNYPWPYTEICNHLYIFPVTVAIKVKFKNPVIKCYLLDGDNSFEKRDFLRNIYPKQRESGCMQVGMSSVGRMMHGMIYFFDEFKIELPLNPSPNLHALFLITNARFNELGNDMGGLDTGEDSDTKPEDSSARKNIEGESNENAYYYAYLRLFKYSMPIFDGEYYLPIVFATEVSNYLEKDLVAIKEDSKNVMLVRTRMHSTIFVQDSYLARYFRAYNNFRVIRSKEQFKTALKSFYKVDLYYLIKYFPVIMNMLLKLLVRVKASKLRTKILITFLYVIKSVSEYSNGNFEYSNLLYSYVSWHFDLEAGELHEVILSSWMHTLKSFREEMVRQGCNSYSEFLSNASISKKRKALVGLVQSTLKVGWFIFELMYKSLLLKLAKNGGNPGRMGVTTPRFRHDFVEFFKFVDYYRRNIGLNFSVLNRNIAFMIVKFFNVLDGDFMRFLVDLHLGYMHGTASFMFRIRFLHLICDSEHYVPINRAGDMVIGESEGNFDIEARFLRRFFLSNSFIRELKQLLIKGDITGDARLKLVRCVRDLFWKHYMDDRYSSKKRQMCVALMYLPLLIALVENVKCLENVGREEIEEWCVCCMWILASIDRFKHLEPLLKGNEVTIEGLLVILRYGIEVLHDKLKVLAVSMDVYEVLSGQDLSPKCIEGVLRSATYCLSHLKPQRNLISLILFVGNTLKKYSSMAFGSTSFNTIIFDLIMYIFSIILSSNQALIKCCTSLLYLMLYEEYRNNGNVLRIKSISMFAIFRPTKSHNFDNAAIFSCLKSIAKHEMRLRPPPQWNEQLLLYVEQISHSMQDYVDVLSEEICEFFELKEELMYKIALDCIHNHDIHVEWLENLALFHISRKCFEEAACCKIYIARFVLQQLKGNSCENSGIVFPEFDWKKIVPSIQIDQRLFRDDKENMQITWSTINEDVFITSMNEAVELFIKSERLELAIETQINLLTYFKENGRWNALSQISQNLSKISDQAYTANRSQSRISSNYYRVGFYGKGFNKDDGLEYIYCMNPSIRMTDWITDMRQRYEKKLGKENFDIISNKPIQEQPELDLENKNYLQIVSCELDLESSSDHDSFTYLNQTFNLSKFFYAIPYTPEKSDGASSNLSNTWKRKFKLETCSSFPNIRSRLLVTKKEITILEPIDSALDMINFMVSKFKQSLNCVPPNIKNVQSLLQGCILTQVNVGPLAVIEEFLGNSEKYPQKIVKKLIDEIKVFIRLCQFGLRLNEKLIEKDPSSLPLHKAISEAFVTLKNAAKKHGI